MPYRCITAMLAVIAIAALSGSGLMAQQPDPSHTPEGAWLMTGTFGPGSTFLWMDTYTSDSTNQGRSGTVLCTLPNATSTHSGHGVWVRIDKNRFAFTAWRIMVVPNSQPVQPVGMAKYWGTVTITGSDTMTGTLNARFYNLAGGVLNTMQGGTSSGTRVQIEYE